MPIENNNYRLEVRADGIYLFKKIRSIDDLAQQLADTSISKQSRSKKAQTEKQIRLEQEEKITLVGSSYELLFAIVDAIVNRSLQVNFSFDTDTYAYRLRIIFSLLVPTLNSDQLFAYDKSLFTKSNTANLSAEQFMAIKRVLDSDPKQRSLADKESLFDLEREIITELDASLQFALENYHSDDSDVEASSSEDEEDPTPPNVFTYNLKTAAKSRHKQAEADASAINSFLGKRNPKKDSLDSKDGKVTIKNNELETIFLIPGFRGINHMPLRFSTEARRLYRQRIFQERRTQIPYFSESILMSRFDFYRDVTGIQKHLVADNEDNTNMVELANNARELERILIGLRNDDLILVKGLSNQGSDDVRLFSNFLHFLQHLYSNGIIKSQRFLREHLLRSEQLFPTPNAYNPFVSESELPEHALRYGFGQKSLYQPAALRPHYNSKGKPAFPYIGEIHLSARNMDVFTGERERHQLRRLERMHRVNPSLYIGPEVESTAFAWLPEGEVFYSEAIKCPSFLGHWQNIFHDKYGLTKSVFDSFKRRFTRCRTPEIRDAIESDVIKHLITFYSNKLLKKAVEHAGKNRVLVFLNSDGTLGFNLPVRDMAADSDSDAKTFLEQLAQHLGKPDNLSPPAITVKLTSKTMSVFKITSKEFDQRLKQFMASHKQYANERADYTRDEELLKTPPAGTSTPRTSSSKSSTRSSDFFSLSGSPGTPLSSRPYSLNVSPILAPQSGNQGRLSPRSLLSDFDEFETAVDETTSFNTAHSSSNENSRSAFFPGTLFPSSLGRAANRSLVLTETRQAFNRNTVLDDGDCGFTAFGITRDHAHRLLRDNIGNINHILRPVLAEQLRDPAFIKWLASHEGNFAEVENAFSTYQSATGKEAGEASEALADFADDIQIAEAYIDYDVREKKIDMGWAHPNVLQALAHLREIRLCFWKLDNDGTLIPYDEFHDLGDEEAPSTNLLFVNGNHFERLEGLEGLGTLEPTPVAGARGGPK